MKRFVYIMMTLFIVSACSTEEDVNATEDENIDIDIDNVVIPTTIFTSDKSGSEIETEEIKQSIQVYLDSNEDLYNVSNAFQEVIYEDQVLGKENEDKLLKLMSLTKENDENFSKYIQNNKLPNGYQEESERISAYISSLNQYLFDLDELLDQFESELTELRIPSVSALTGDSKIVNGREQKKIEEFLDKEGIQTKAFKEN